MVTLRTGRPCTDVVMGVHKPDGTRTWITVNAQPLFEADGRTLAGVVASFEDITGRKRAEDALRKTAEQLACCEEQLQRLTAAAAMTTGSFTRVFSLQQRAEIVAAQQAKGALRIGPAASRTGRKLAHSN